LKENNMTDMTRDELARTDLGVRLTYSGRDVDGAEQIDDAEFAARSRPICPITGRQCEGDLSHLCEDYGCARKGGLSPHSHENF